MARSIRRFTAHVLVLAALSLASVPALACGSYGPPISQDQRATLVADILASLTDPEWTTLEVHLIDTELAWARQRRGTIERSVLIDRTAEGWRVRDHASSS